MKLFKRIGGLAFLALAFKNVTASLPSCNTKIIGSVAADGQTISDPKVYCVNSSLLTQGTYCIDGTTIRQVEKDDSTSITGQIYSTSTAGYGVLTSTYGLSTTDTINKESKYQLCNNNLKSTSVSSTTGTTKVFYYFFSSANEIVTSTVGITSYYKCSANGTAGASTTTTTVYDATNCETLDIKTRYYINAATNGITNALVYCTASASCTASENGKANAYYPADVNTENKSILIKCSTESCAEMLSGLDASYTGSKYYISTRTGYLIKCTPASCDNIAVTTESYFINNGVDPYQLIYCTSTSCESITTTSGYYLNGDNSKLIFCSTNGCDSEESPTNFYVSTTPNILIDCTSGSCSYINAKIGIYLAGKVPDKIASGLPAVFFISCDATTCNELSTTESENVKTCNVSGNKCTIKLGKVTSINPEATELIPEGSYCTNAYKTALYFATDTIEVETSNIQPTSSNCIAASSTYYQYYYTVGSIIYHIDDGEISQITAAGYYFINTNTNKLVTGSKIEDFNEDGVKLYKCNGTSCSVVSTPTTTSYYVDVSKRIFKYTGNAFAFAYEKDTLCQFGNSGSSAGCTPSTDMVDTEFCVTSSGELVVVVGDIEAKKSGQCFKSNNINTEIFGYYSHLYRLNMYDATLVDVSGYYIVSLNSNSTTEFKEFSNKNTEIMIYGCNSSSCGVKTLEDNVYYYDRLSNYLVKYDSTNKQWQYPTVDGYALVSEEPGVNYIRHFTIDSSTSKVTLGEKVRDGYYYTIDNEMYGCPNTEGNSCSLITDSMYVMTNTNELYFCTVDSDTKSTACNKQSCILGQIYYIAGYHFRCVAGNMFNILSTKYCNKEDTVIVNYPIAFSESFPSNVKSAVEDIQKHNNSTATVKAGSNHLAVVPGLFTNCTYNKEEKTAQFDLVCIENYVVVNDDEEPKICSTTKAGFVGCNDDADNPDKCNPSSAMTIFLSKIAIAFAALLLTFIIY